MIREDYIHRMIRQLAEALARIAGFNRKGSYAEALDAAARAWGELLPEVPRELVEVVDTPTLAGLLREPDKMRAAAQLLTEEGRALAGKGDPASASMRYRRAIELLLEARAIDPDPADDAAILELSREVPAAQLAARYRTT